MIEFESRQGRSQLKEPTMMKFDELPTEWRVFICKCSDGYSPGPKLKALRVSKYMSELNGFECDWIMLVCSECEKPRLWLLNTCATCGELFLRDFRHPAVCYSSECLAPNCFDCLEKHYSDRVCGCSGDKIRNARVSLGIHDPYFKDIGRRVKALRESSDESVFSFD